MARRKNPESDTPTDPFQTVAEAVLNPQSSVDQTFAPAADPVLMTDPLPPPPPEPPPAAAAPRRPGIFGPILGGALAAVAGFGLSHFNAFGLSASDTSGDLAALSARLAALETAEPPSLLPLQDSLTALQTRIVALEEAPPPAAPDLSALDQRLAAIEAIPAGGDASTAALAAKLAELERRLAAQPAGGADTAKVDAALARLEAAEAEATARATAATEAAAAAERGVALDRLREAAATGTAFDAELAALADPALTAALTPHVGGVATLAQLQADFPDLARQALETARAAEGDPGWGTRLLNFLASQTGARPLTPQDGTTPEAILSRADFAVAEGRLADALTEIATLPPDVMAVFAEWTARAGARLAVDTALEAR